MDTTLSRPPAGQLLDGRYRVEAWLAQGGMATVYLGTDTRLDRPVALKIARPELTGDEEFVRRFIAEAHAVARLSSPHVVAVYDQGTDGQFIYLAMEYVRGQTLREVLRQRGRLTAREALDVMEGALAGLAAAHAAGIIHRDVKPENVLISHTGEVKMADFGLARAAAAASRTKSGMLIGTAAYLAPEQVSRSASDARTDVYAAGIMLFEMLTGRQPHSGGTPLDVAYKHVNEVVPAPSSALPGLPPAMDALVAMATSRNPDLRPHDASQFLHAITEVRRTLPAQPGDPQGTAQPGAAQFGGAPFGGAPFGGAPFGGAPFGGAPLGGAPLGGAQHGGPAYNGEQSNGAPPGWAPASGSHPGVSQPGTSQPGTAWSGSSPGGAGGQGAHAGGAGGPGAHTGGAGGPGAHAGGAGGTPMGQDAAGLLAAGGALAAGAAGAELAGRNGTAPGGAHSGDPYSSGPYGRDPYASGAAQPGDAYPNGGQPGGAQSSDSYSSSGQPGGAQASGAHTDGDRAGGAQTSGSPPSGAYSGAASPSGASSARAPSNDAYPGGPQPGGAHAGGAQPGDLGGAAAVPGGGAHASGDESGESWPAGQSWPDAGPSAPSWPTSTDDGDDQALWPAPPAAGTAAQDPVWPSSPATSPGRHQAGGDGDSWTFEAPAAGATASGPVSGADGTADYGTANFAAANSGPANGWSANDGTANGVTANGWTADGGATNGGVANGGSANGWTGNSGAANGETAHGWAANGEAANGGAANGETAHGWAANGGTANWWAANGGAGSGPGGLAAPFPWAAGPEGGPADLVPPGNVAATTAYPPADGATLSGGAYPAAGVSSADLAYPAAAAHPAGVAYPPAGGAGSAYPPAGGAYPAAGAYPPAGGAGGTNHTLIVTPHDLTPPAQQRQRRRDRYRDRGQTSYRRRAEPLLQRLLFSRKVVYLGGAAVVVLLIVGMFWWLTSGQYTQVPQVHGMSATLAKTELTNLGFDVKAGPAQHNNLPKGEVIKTTPGAGLKASQGATITVIASLGPVQINVPQVTGLTLAEAQAELKKEGLTPGQVTQATSTTIAAGIVINTDPVAGTSWPQPKPVALTVSEGPPLPNLVGEQLAAAQGTAGSGGYSLNPVMVHSDQPVNTILRQSPRPGTPISPHEVVTVKVSEGPPMVNIPNVQGMKVDQAEQILTQAGFQVQINSVMPGHWVMSYSPTGQAPKGSTITLTVGFTFHVP